MAKQQKKTLLAARQDTEGTGLGTWGGEGGGTEGLQGGVKRGAVGWGLATAWGGAEVASAQGTEGPGGVGRGRERRGVELEVARGVGEEEERSATQGGRREERVRRGGLGRRGGLEALGVGPESEKPPQALDSETPTQSDSSVVRMTSSTPHQASMSSGATQKKPRFKSNLSRKMMFASHARTHKGSHSSEPVPHFPGTDQFSTGMHSTSSGMDDVQQQSLSELLTSAVRYVMGQRASPMPRGSQREGEKGPQGGQGARSKLRWRSFGSAAALSEQGLAAQESSAPDAPLAGTAGPDTAGRVVDESTAEDEGGEPKELLTSHLEGAGTSAAGMMSTARREARRRGGHLATAVKALPLNLSTASQYLPRRASHSLPRGAGAFTRTLPQGLPQKPGTGTRDLPRGPDDISLLPLGTDDVSLQREDPLPGRAGVPKAVRPDDSQVRLAAGKAGAYSEASARGQHTQTPSHAHPRSHSPSRSHSHARKIILTLSIDTEEEPPGLSAPHSLSHSHSQTVILDIHSGDISADVSSAGRHVSNWGGSRKGLHMERRRWWEGPEEDLHRSLDLRADVTSQGAEVSAVLPPELSKDTDRAAWESELRAEAAQRDASGAPLESAGSGPGGGALVPGLDVLGREEIAPEGGEEGAPKGRGQVGREDGATVGGMAEGEGREWILSGFRRISMTLNSSQGNRKLKLQ